MPAMRSQTLCCGSNAKKPDHLTLQNSIFWRKSVLVDGASLVAEGLAVAEEVNNIVDVVVAQASMIPIGKYDSQAPTEKNVS